MIAGLAYAEPGDPELAGNVSLEQGILQVLERYGEDRADWGIQVKSLERGENLVHLNPGRRYMPASNLKLLVTAVALDQLGADYRWATSVLSAGEIERLAR